MEDKVDNISRKFEEVIDEIDKCGIFKNKLQCLANVLGANEDSIQELDNKNQNSELEGKLDKLAALLEGLLEKVKLLNDSLFWSFLQENKPIESIFTDITEKMNKIFELLQDMGIEKPAKLQPERFFQDYVQVYDLLDVYIDMFQKRKKEIRTILNHCSNNPVNLSNESAREILKRYDKYSLEPNDYKIGEHLYYSAGPFDYYKGTVILTKEQVTLMKLLDNTHLGRILDVLSQMDNDGVEKLIGFYDENSKDEEKEPKVTIVTKRVGVDLFSFLHSNERIINKYKFQPGDRTILAFKIAKAMSYIHSRNVIHRNLVPSSVYINKKDENEDIDAMIVGFRSSRVMPNTVAQNMTNRNDLIFDSNPTNFFAPEYDNNSQYNEKIDVFSFAGIIFELATGESPYSDCSEKETKSKLKAGKLPEIKKGVPSDLIDLIEHCWKIEPNDRYSFNDIVNVMAQKNIIFDQDKEKEEYIKDFYEKNTSNREKISTAVELIDNTKNNIIKSYQYRHELFRTRSTLNYYQSFLNHDYKAPENDNDEEKEKIDNLIFNLQQYSSVVAKTLYDNWINMASTLEVSKITEDINEFMIEIDESMRELGYIGGEPYQVSIDDLIFDYRELYITFETDRTFDKKVSTDKRKEIVKYLREKDPNYLKQIKNPSKPITYRKIVDLFSYFCKYENHIVDFEKSFEAKRGKKSIIYQGYNVKTGIPVAIKVFNGTELGKSENNLINLRRELEYASKVNFKYIAKFVGYAIDEETNDVWLITELAKNASMDQVLKNTNSTLTPYQKTKIAFRLAETMNYLNSQNISHGALTSSNVIIEGDKPKLIDFGNASPDIKDVDFEINNATQDEVGYDTRNDIFAFSMLLYEMLNGTTAQRIDTTINEDNDTDLMKLIKNGLQDGNPENLTFERIINKMINSRISFPGATKEEIDEFYGKERNA